MGLALGGELGGDQAMRSSYFEIFRDPTSQDQFLANDALGLKNLYAISGMPEGKAAPYLEALGTPEALGAALNWYRAADLTLVEAGSHHHAHDVRVVDGLTRPRPGRRRPRVGSSQGPTGSRCSKGSATGYQNRYPSGSTGCCSTTSGDLTEH